MITIILGFGNWISPTHKALRDCILVGRERALTFYNTAMD